LPGERFVSVMRRRALAAAWLGGVLLVGCDLSSALRPTPRRAVVHAVLDLASDNQLIFLEWAHTGAQVSGTNSFGATDPIPGAQVTVTAPDGTIMTAEPEIDQSSRRLIPGFYRLSLVRYAASLAPGASYSLKVSLQSGEEISGTTTMPTVTASSSTALETFRLCDTLRLRWPRVAGAAAYEVRIQIRENNSITAPPYVIFADSVALVPGFLDDLYGDQVFVSGFSYDIVVSAVDANYYDYYRTQPDPFTPALPSRLRGALGVFGSVAPLVSHPVQAANCTPNRP
jgi:uncharacterized protein DUF4249